MIAACSIDTVHRRQQSTAERASGPPRRSAIITGQVSRPVAILKKPPVRLWLLAGQSKPPARARKVYVNRPGTLAASIASPAG